MRRAVPFLAVYALPVDPTWRGADMTVCVAALCVQPGGPVVVAAADRMLTAGGTEYEPPLQKVWQFSASIAALVAGDMNLQAELMAPVWAEVLAAIRAAPDVWLKVEDVAKLYRDRYTETRRAHAESGILAPLGLTVESFLTRQRELDSALVETLSDRLATFRLPETSAIFMGIDETGGHLFECVDGELFYRNSARFAAIGSGWSHAESEMMSASHLWLTDVLEAVVLVHSAKKRAESAPGVGTATDMLMAGPALGTLVHMNAWNNGAAVAALDREYTKRVRRERRAAENAKSAFRSFIQSATALPQNDRSLDGAANEAGAAVDAASEPRITPEADAQARGTA